jgi:uncharacterized tellurite resistance protein B-like protein
LNQESRVAHLCPHCEQRNLETVATLPYVRGFLIAFQIGTKKFIGCQSCVRGKIFKEVGFSALVGWFSVTAAIINPFLLAYGVVKGLTVSANPQGVQRVLTEAGIPLEPAGVDVLSVAYSLAASMIAADGKIEDSEVEAAVRVGSELFEGFDPNALMQHLHNHRDLPDPSDLAALLASVMDEPGKRAVYSYLEAIAAADGDVAADEAALLQSVHFRLGLTQQLPAAA